MRLYATAICFTPMVGVMFVPLFAPVVGAAPTATTHIEPAEIDRAIAEFVNADIGEIGGALTPTDPRLRLSACPAPLAVSWHGTSEKTVRVDCPAPGGWRIFVSTRARPAATPAKRAVKRGDTVTVAVRGAGFTVQQSGEALGSGAIGEWIEVRTARKKEPVRAQIVRPGLAVIPAG